MNAIQQIIESKTNDLHIRIPDEFKGHRLAISIVDLDDEDGKDAEKAFPVTTIDEVAGCLPYDGPALSSDDMDDAIARGIREQWTKQ